MKSNYTEFNDLLNYLEQFKKNRKNCQMWIKYEALIKDLEKYQNLDHFNNQKVFFIFLYFIYVLKKKKKIGKLRRFGISVLVKKNI